MFSAFRGCQHLREIELAVLRLEKIGAADEAEREKAIAFTKKYLQIAAWIGAETIPFSRLPDLVLPDQALAEKVVREMKEICS